MEYLLDPTEDYSIQGPHAITLAAARRLHAAVLERAFRDLTAKCEQHIRRSAIKWFKKEKSGYITFCDCKESLELSSTKITFIMETVDEVREYLDRIREKEKTYQIKRHDRKTSRKQRVAVRHNRIP